MIELTPRQHAARSIATGAVGGLFSGLTGVGGGAIMVPLLTMLLGMPQRLAHGTSLAIIIFVAAMGVIPYIATGDIQWSAAAALAVGSIFAAMIGARAMSSISEHWLQRIFAVFLFFVALRMFFA